MNDTYSALSSANWAGMSPQEKLDAARTLICEQIPSLKDKEFTLEFSDELPLGCTGQTVEGRHIQFSNSLFNEEYNGPLADSLPLLFASCAVHESRHVYQHAVIDGEIMGLLGEAERFACNGHVPMIVETDHGPIRGNGYMNGELHGILYDANPIEVDARAAAESAIAEIIQANPEDPAVKPYLAHLAAQTESREQLAQRTFGCSMEELSRYTEAVLMNSFFGTEAENVPHNVVEAIAAEAGNRQFDIDREIENALAPGVSSVTQTQEVTADTLIGSGLSYEEELMALLNDPSQTEEAENTSSYEEELTALLNEQGSSVENDAEIDIEIGEGINLGTEFDTGIDTGNAIIEGGYTL